MRNIVQLPDLLRAKGWASGSDRGQAVTGHKKAETFAKYRAKANRSTLADRALSNLATRFDLQPSENEEETET